MELNNLKYLIVGAGFYGSVLAEKIANEKKEKVLLIDKRSHFGGNCWSEADKETGIEYHVYGTHIFHTSIRRVKDYIDRFSEFNGYRHQVLASHNNRLYQLPFNLETINSFYNVNLKPYEVKEFLDKEIKKENISEPNNLEEKAISLIGRPLYEAFVKGYTMKQWEKDPKDLPASIINRLPVRNNYNESYFFDAWQGIPTIGFGPIFKKMLSSDLIDFQAGIDYHDIKDKIPENCKVIYSGTIDSFYNYKFGSLEWRSLKFEKEIKNVEDYQGTSVINYPGEDVAYTRIHEPRHLHDDRNYTKEKTIIIKEYPSKGIKGDEYYPVNTPANNEMFKKYDAERKKEKSVIIGGRLGDYKYYDMDKVIDTALSTFDNL